MSGPVAQRLSPGDVLVFSGGQAGKVCARSGPGAAKRFAARVWPGRNQSRLSINARAENNRRFEFVVGTFLRLESGVEPGPFGGNGPENGSLNYATGG